jgi:hypothetical protein
MNTAQIKLVTWSAAGVLGLGLVAYIAVFLRQRADVMTPVSTDRMRGVLEKVPEIEQRTENTVAFPAVQKGLQRFDWAGKPPPDVQAEAPVADKPKAGPDPVSMFVKIRGLKADADQPERGEVVLKYTSDARVTAVTSDNGTVLKIVGDALDPPLDYIKVAAVTDLGVEFSFTDPPDRKHEILLVNDYPLVGYLLVDGDSITQVAAPKTSFPTAPRTGGPPVHTEKISPTRYRIGTDDANAFQDNYSDILSEDVSYKRHRDPKTGRYDGIEVTAVKPGSIVAQHGIMNGDVIKSINGNPVNSENEAIQFVKTHKDEYDTWEVVIENKGQSRTMTYNSPQH